MSAISASADMKYASGAEEGIMVAIRMRPLNSRETNDNRSRSVWRVLQKYNSVTQCTPEGKPLPERINGRNFFTYDRTFGEASTTRQVYDEVAKGIVGSVTNGLNGTIFAYGQTSSGKTYTMQGSGSIESISNLDVNGGIVHMAASDIFSHIENDADRVFLVRVSFIEIYNEEVRDLLVSGGDDNTLSVREDPNRGVFVNSNETIVIGLDSVLSVLFAGEKNRSVAATGMNERSSRSHTIFRITVESRLKSSEKKRNGDGCSDDETDLDGDDGEFNDGNSAVRVSTLNLVDLAGSESVRLTGATGDRQKEGGKINQSLLSLSRVIGSLSQNAAHVNFRDSKLTYILKPSLSGNARMAVICCATPSELYLEETRSTLQFASRAKLVKTRAQVNEVLDDRSLIKKLQRELKEARNAGSGNVAIEQLKALEEKAANEGVAKRKAEHDLKRMKDLILKGGVLPRKILCFNGPRKTSLFKSLFIYNDLDETIKTGSNSFSLCSKHTLKRRRRFSDGVINAVYYSPSRDLSTKCAGVPNEQKNVHSTPVRDPFIKLDAKTEVKRKKPKNTALISTSDLTKEDDISLLRKALASKSAQVSDLKDKLLAAGEKAKYSENILQSEYREKEMLYSAKKDLESQVKMLASDKEFVLTEKDIIISEKDVVISNSLQQIESLLSDRKDNFGYINDLTASVKSLKDQMDVMRTDHESEVLNLEERLNNDINKLQLELASYKNEAPLNSNYAESKTVDYENDLRELKSSLELAEQNVTSLNDSLASTTAKNNTLESELNVTSAATTANNVKYENSLRELQLSLDLAEHNVTSLNDRLVSTIAEKDAVASELNETYAKVEVVEYEKALRELQSSLELAEHNVTSLNDRLESTIGEKDALASELNETSSTLNDTKMQNVEYETSLIEMRSSVEIAETNVASLKDSLMLIAGEKEGLESRISQLLQTIEELTKSSNDFIVQLETSKGEHEMEVLALKEQFNNDYMSLKVEFEEFKNEASMNLNEAKAQVIEHETSLADMRSSLGQATGKVASLNDILLSSNSDKEILAQNVSEQLQTIEELKKSSQESIIQLEASKSKHDSEIQSLQERFSKEHNDLRLEFATYKSETSGNLNDAKEKIIQYETSLTEMRSSLEGANTTVASLNDSLVTTVVEKGSLESRISQLLQTIEEHTKSSDNFIVQLETTKGEHEMEVLALKEHFNNDYNSLQLEFEEFKNEASMNLNEAKAKVIEHETSLADMRLSLDQATDKIVSLNDILLSSNSDREILARTVSEQLQTIEELKKSSQESSIQLEASKSKHDSEIQSLQERFSKEHNDLRLEFATYKSETSGNLNDAKEKIIQYETSLTEMCSSLEGANTKIASLNDSLVTTVVEKDSLESRISQLLQTIEEHTKSSDNFIVQLTSKGEHEMEVLALKEQFNNDYNSLQLEFEEFKNEASMNLNEAKAQVIEHETSLADVRSSLDQATDKNVSLNDILLSSNSDREILGRTVSEQLQTIEELKKSSQESSIQLEAFKSKHDVEIQSLQERFSKEHIDLQLEFATYKSETCGNWNDAKEKIVHYESSLTEMRSSLEEANTKVASLNDSLMSTVVEKEILESRISALLQTIEELTTSSKDLILQLETSKGEHEIEILALKEQFKSDSNILQLEFTSVKNESSMELNDTKAKVLERETSLKEVRSSLDQATNKIASLNEILNSSDTEKASLACTVSEQLQTIGELTESSKVAILELEGVKAKHKIEIQTLQEKLNKEHMDLQFEFAAYKSETSENLNDAKEKIIQYETSLSEMHSSLEVAKTNVASFKDSLTSTGVEKECLASRISELLQTIEDLTTSSRDLILQLETSKSYHETEVQTLKEKLDDDYNMLQLEFTVFKNDASINLNHANSKITAFENSLNEVGASLDLSLSNTSSLNDRLACKLSENVTLAATNFEQSRTIEELTKLSRDLTFQLEEAKSNTESQVMSLTEQFNSECNRLQLELTAYKTDSSDHLIDANSRNIEFESSLEGIRSSLELAESKNTTLNDSLALTIAEKEILESRLSKQFQTIKELTLSCKDLSQKFDVTKLNYDSEVLTLKEHFSGAIDESRLELSRHKNEASAKLNAAETKIIEYETALQEMRSNVASFKTRESDVQTLTDQLNNDRISLQLEFTSYKNEASTKLNDSKLKLIEYETHLKDLRSSLDIAQTNISSLREELNNQQILHAEQLISTKTALQKELDQKRFEMDRTCKMLNEELSKVSILSETNNKLKTSVEEMEGIVQEKNARIDNFSTRAATLQSKLDSASDEKRTLASQVEDLQRQNDQLNILVSEADHSMTNIDSAVHDLAEQIQSLESSLSTLLPKGAADELLDEVGVQDNKINSDQHTNASKYLRSQDEILNLTRDYQLNIAIDHTAACIGALIETLMIINSRHVTLSTTHCIQLLTQEAEVSTAKLSQIESPLAECLEEHVKVLQSEKEDILRKMENVVTTNNLLIQDLDRKESDINKLRDQRDRAISELERSLFELETLKTGKESAIHKLDKIETASSLLRAEKVASEMKFSEQLTGTEASIEVLTSIKSEKDAFSITRMENYMVGLNTENEDARSKIGLLHTSIEDLRERNANLNAELTEANSKVCELLSHRIALEDTKQQGTTSVDVALVSSLRGEIKELKMLIASSNESVEEARSAALEADQELEEKKRELERALSLLAEVEEAKRIAEDKLRLAKNNSQEELLRDLELLMTEKLEVESRLENEVMKKRQFEDEIQMAAEEEKQSLVAEAENKMIMLREEIAQLKIDLSRIESEWYTAKDEIEDLRDKNERSESQFKDAESSLASLTEELKTENEKKDALLQQISRLEEESITFKSRAYSMKASLEAEAKVKITNMESKLTEAQSSFNQSQREIKLLNETIADLTKDILTYQDQTESMKLTAANEIEIEKSRISEELARVKVQLSTMNSDYLSAKNEVALAQNKISQVKKREHEKQQALAQKAKDSIEQLQNRLMRAEEKIKEASRNTSDGELASLRSQLDALKISVQEKDLRIKKLEKSKMTKEQVEKIRKIQEERVKYMTEAKDFKERIEVLETQISNGKTDSKPTRYALRERKDEDPSDMARLKDELIKCNMKLQKYVHHSERLEKERNTVIAALSSCTMENDAYNSLEEMAVALVENLKSIQEECDALANSEDKAAMYLADLESLRGQFLCLQDQLEMYKESNNKLADSYEDCKSSLVRADERIAVLLKDKESLQTFHVSAKGSMADLQSEQRRQLSFLENENLQLGDELKGAKKELLEMKSQLDSIHKVTSSTDEATEELFGLTNFLESSNKEALGGSNLKCDFQSSIKTHNSSLLGEDWNDGEKENLRNHKPIRNDLTRSPFTSAKKRKTVNPFSSMKKASRKISVTKSDESPKHFPLSDESDQTGEMTSECKQS